MVTDEKFKKTANIIINFVIIMGQVMISVMAPMLSNVTGAFVEGFGGAAAEMAPKGKKAATKADVKKASQEIKKQIQTGIKGMAKDITKQLKETRPQLEAEMEKNKETFTDKFCDEGIKIVQKYKFNLPKLYEELKEDDLIGYVTTGLKEDSNFSKFMEELTAWMEKAPPEAMEKIKKT